MKKKLRDAWIALKSFRSMGACYIGIVLGRLFVSFFFLVSEVGEEGCGGYN